ncbi:MAG TPA: gluconokinase [Verrucomicrobiae bacterium]|nr:gluconokinase [Verrucomicrobiae bacterium]
MKRDFCVGVDIGTTSVKACVAAAGFEPVVQKHAYPMIKPRPGWAEQDPELIFEAVVECVRNAIEQAGAKPQEIAAISLGSALHSILAIGRDGRPLSNSITWADNRSERQAFRLKRSEEGLSIYRRTGMPIHAMSPLAKVLWFREERGEIFERATKFVSIKEYVAQKLLGKHTVDYSTASGSGFLNLAKLGWDEEALELAGIRGDQLGSPEPPTAVARGVRPEYAHAMGISPDVRTVLGASDAVLSHLGVGAFETGQYSVTIGTSSGLRTLAPNVLVDGSGGTFCYAFTEGLWLVGCPCSTGGISLQWFNETFPGKSAADGGKDDSIAASIAAALALPIGAEGLLSLPFIAGERAPGRNPDARGVFFGIGLHHRREHFVRAIVEGILLSVYSLYSPLQQMGIPVKETRISGGFASTPGVPQAMADVFGHDVLVPRFLEAASYGSALLAMYGVGLLSSLTEIPRKVEIGERLPPDLQRHGNYKELSELFENVNGNLDRSFTLLKDFRERNSDGGNEGAS